MSNQSFDRRTLLKHALLGLASLPVIGAITEAAAQAPAAAAKVSEKDPTAVALAYVEDVKKVDAAKNPNYKPGQDCANCVQLVGKPGDAYRPCNVFGGKLVNEKGWCKVWTLKPGAKLG
jgi:hypothetical protein